METQKHRSKTTIVSNPDCRTCHKRRTKLTLVKDDKFTQNTTWVCTNPDCSSYIDITKVENWKKRK